MATPQDHLPPPIPSSTITSLVTSLSFPAPSTITTLPASASFHSIYLLHYPASHRSILQTPHPVRPVHANPDDSITLILRISGNHIARTKTANEVGIMTWLRQHTGIPVPAILRYDTSQNNILQREYTLLEKIPGRSVDTIYKTLNEETKGLLVQQLTDILVELNSHSWNHIGGLQLIDEEIVPGPVLEDTFWLVPDIQTYWTSESVDSLNPAGPYSSHGDYLAGYLTCFIHAINNHESLSWIQHITPRLVALISNLPTMDLSTKLILAHKDLHFANVMATDDGDITGILDWEFAGVVPALRWDPVRAFLWSGEYTDDAHAEKNRLRRTFEAELRERGVEMWWDGASDAVEAVWEVVRFMRAIVEVCPKGQKKDAAVGWANSAKQALSKLGV
ncbi:hypothetical protein QQS21_002271 [Conoideocrella luteorostrata]|uniref:Aminoglycoside phosphotransferase domain-containing protein n=1 Tax=Conoideocrella luteorostrata TaxID=1105319 RepID=A0AAJ0CY19_9HYPO|nr:hypothetical protein QQS21_002271 [Conoideocrella luteorostrata]